jgi:hypothetical protein
MIYNRVFFNHQLASSTIARHLKHCLVQVSRCKPLLITAIEIRRHVWLQDGLSTFDGRYTTSLNSSVYYISWIRQVAKTHTWWHIPRFFFDRHSSLPQQCKPLFLLMKLWLLKGMFIFDGSTVKNQFRSPKD